MKHRKTFSLSIGLVTAAFLIVASAFSLRAEDETTSRVQGEATVGMQSFLKNDFADSAKFEEFREVPSGVVLENLNFVWKGEGRWFLDAEVFDAAQKDQKARAVFGQDKIWRAYVAWSENPRRFMDGAKTLYGGGAEHLTLPASVQVNDGAILKDAIVNSASPVDLSYQRSTLDEIGRASCRERV